ncbi:N-acetylglutamate synthase, GNAT family [Devosia lucknowensis]|uniref:N-acetylglutamate synthase, GNAT family n=1 Tax=Devosia lucknowensis TaxID=1096929 RepID=A0A1Y6G9Q7_9HYPH|nr:N-acetylglutamate synthase, GNAT family [Devosia lucknowensis]
MIRKPTLQEVPALHRLIEEHAAFERSVAPLSTDALAAVMAVPGMPVRFIVADRDGQLLGYAAVTFDWSVWRARRFAHLDCLYVAQNDRRQGIGKLLFAGARRIALDEGVDRMEWQTPAWNLEADAFYRREGAVAADKIRYSLAISSQIRL